VEEELEIEQEEPQLNWHKEELLEELQEEQELLQEELQKETQERDTED